MRASCVKNGLVVGVILLFIGVCAYPTFATNMKDYSSSEISEKDYSTPISQEVYENHNCLVIGKSSDTLKFLSGIFNKSISFGIRNARDGEYDPAKGWIYTKGSQGKWLYKGKFWGNLGIIKLDSSGVFKSYKGIKNFNGICLGGLHHFISPFDAIFIGYAKEVKITTNKPWKT